MRKRRVDHDGAAGWTDGRTDGRTDRWAGPGFRWRLGLAMREATTDGWGCLSPDRFHKLCCCCCCWQASDVSAARDDRRVRPSREESVVAELISLKPTASPKGGCFFLFGLLWCFFCRVFVCPTYSLSFFLSFFLLISGYFLFPLVLFLVCPGDCSTHFLPLHLRPHHHSERQVGGQSDNTLFESCHLLQAAPNFCARLLFKSPSVWLFLLLQQPP